MNPRHSRIVRLIALLSVAIPLLMVSATSAQDVPTEIDFTIASFSCPSDPGQVSMAAGNIPDTCTPDVGAVASVALQDGTTVGSCTTDATGICKLQAPNEATVVVTLDGSSISGGGVARENPITTQVVTEFAGALFINLPASPVPPSVPTELPDTGSGMSVDRSSSWTVLASVVTFASAMGAIGLRVSEAKVRK